MGHSQVSDSTRSWLIRKQTGKGFPQVPDGLGFGLVFVHGRPEEGGLCEAEGVGQGLRLVKLRMRLRLLLRRRLWLWLGLWLWLCFL